MASSGPRALARLTFAAVWIAAQLALILTAGARPDAAFGFRMFPESSTVAAHLSRAIAGGDGVVDVKGAAWSARDRAGAPHRVEWTDYDKSGEHAFDVTFFASYGVEAQLERWRAALDYVAPRHGRVDAQTQALVAVLSLS